MGKRVGCAHMVRDMDTCRALCLDKNLKHNSISLSHCSVKVTLYVQVDGSRGFILTKDNCIIV
jgi:hypothetical protein